MRRICAQRRKDLLQPTHLMRDPRFDVTKNRKFVVYFTKFKALHGMVRPGGSTNNDSDLFGVETVPSQLIPQQQAQASYPAPNLARDELMSIGMVPPPSTNATQTIPDSSIAFATPQTTNKTMQTSEPTVSTHVAAPTSPQQVSITNMTSLMTTLTEILTENLMVLTIV